MGCCGALAGIVEQQRRSPAIYARCPSGGGVTYAVANRLKKRRDFTLWKEIRDL